MSKVELKKCLGVSIDYKLTWKKHISMINLNSLRVVP